MKNIERRALDDSSNFMAEHLATATTFFWIANLPTINYSMREVYMWLFILCQGQSSDI
jgi:hypothetical protein